jgi:uncharacterized protein YodC (DUF2158 family)
MTTNNEFKVGDIVILKSGSPAMTIDKFVWNPLKGEYYTDKVECVWFVKTELKREVFQTSSLEHE